MLRFFALSCCLLLALTVGGCGGGGDATPTGAQPAPTTTEDYETVVAKFSLLQGAKVTFSDPAYVGDSAANEDCRAHLIFDSSSLPSAPNITEVELVIPVTSSFNDPASFVIRLDHEGRATSALTTPDHLMTLADEDLAAFAAPTSRSAGVVPTWRADVTAAVQADLVASHAFTLFRLRTPAGANGNGVQDGWILGQTWAFSGLPYPATLRVTYLTP